MGETLLLDTSTLAYFGLDELGTAFWRELTACEDAAEVFERVSSASGVATDVLARKFSGIIKGLEMTGIITIIPQPNDK